MQFVSFKDERTGEIYSINFEHVVSWFVNKDGTLFWIDVTGESKNSIAKDSPVYSRMLEKFKSLSEE